MTNSNSNTSHYQQLVADIMQMPLKKREKQFLELIKFMKEVIGSREKQLDLVEATVDDLVVNTGLEFSKMREISTSVSIIL